MHISRIALLLTGDRSSDYLTAIEIATSCPFNSVGFCTLLPTTMMWIKESTDRSFVREIWMDYCRIYDGGTAMWCFDRLLV
mmetsp:Transcript_15203/g.22420  ORF Transcript_15203/g.22420 Transcript_15203/m.22420 type:complete len:81 (+) Transcript_15203:1116-1358(+)